MNVITWGINFYLNGVSSVGEGIPLLRHNPAECHICTAERYHRPHAVCGRSAARHILSCGGILKLQGEKESPHLKVCERAMPVDNRVEVAGTWSLLRPRNVLFFTASHTLFFTYTYRYFVLEMHPYIKHDLSSDRHH